MQGDACTQMVFYYQRLQSVDLKSYSAFAKWNLICLIWSSTLENHVVYGLGLAAMLHACVYTSTGTALQWVNELRYPDVFVIRSRTFKCSVDNAKKSFYRSARNVNKTFFQDQDQDFCFKTKTKTKTSEIFQDQDQDQAFLLKTKTKTLHLKTKTKTKTFTQCQVIQRQLQTMQLTEH